MALLRVRCLCTVFLSTNVRNIILKIITCSIKIRTQKVIEFECPFYAEKVQLFDTILVPWGAILEPWATLGGWDHLFFSWDQQIFSWDQTFFGWDQKFFGPPHMGQKRNRHKKNTPTLWGTFGSKIAPQATKVGSKSCTFST